MNALTDSFLSGRDSDVLRFITAGSVDDGKSTLIGRLLYDSKGVFADQLDAIARAKYKRVAEGGIDFALLTDGLEAEREQGITIDVAYRYFSTTRRKFIVADAPGHEQYTRNMVTGASTAQVAVILIDATRVEGEALLPQTRRHSTIAKLLGLRHIVVAVNKMDLVGWDEQVFDRIRRAYTELANSLGIARFEILPLSALSGDNVVTRSERAPWYEGPPLLSILEGLDVSDETQARAARFPVQWVARHDGDRADDFRGYAGRLAAGRLAVGDRVLVQPAGVEAHIRSIRVFDRAIEVAVAGDAVTLELDRDVDVSRGDIIASAERPAQTSRLLVAELCWLDATPMNPLRKYLLKQGTRLTQAKITGLIARREVVALQAQRADEATGTLAMNEIGTVGLQTRDALAYDLYDDIPATGAFILIDAATHQTAAAGMLRGVETTV